MWFRVLVLLFLCFDAEVLAANDSLLMVQVVWRHGARTPTETYPNDPIQSWPEGWGELTRQGFEQHYDLGRTLRDRYVSRKVQPKTTIQNISENYDPTEIYVRSTDQNRTLLSATINMFAFYPYDYASGIKAFNPIPVHTVDETLDSTLNPDRPCARHKYLWNLVMETPEFTSLQTNYSDFFKFVTNQTGMTFTADNLWKLWYIFFIETETNKTMPKWVNQEWKNNQTVYDLVRQLVNKVQGWNNGKHLEKYKGIDFAVEIPKLRGGTLLWAIIGNFQHKWDCILKPSDCYKWTNTIKYIAYSAHDTTLAALFSVFGFQKTNFFDDRYPDYTSCVALELWQNGTDKTKNYIKVYYLPLVGAVNHTTLTDVTPNITNCEPCDLAQFAQRSKLYQPMPNTTNLCNEIPPDVDPISGSPTTPPPPNPTITDSNLTPSLNLSALLMALCAFLLY